MTEAERRLLSALGRAIRLLDVCVFDDRADLEDIAYIHMVWKEAVDD